MQQTNILTDLEWEIMQVVWRHQKVSVKEVWQQAFPKGEKAYTTIQTYMDRMVDKNFLTKEKIGLVNFYAALIDQKAVKKQATEKLAHKVFNGSIGQLAAYLVRDYKLSDKDLDELKQLIEKKERES